LAIPIIIGQVGNVLMGLTDTFFVSKLGVTEIAASGIGNSVFFTTIVIGIGMMISGSAVVAEALGNKDPERIGKLYHSVVWSGIMFGVLMNLVVLFLSFNFGWFQQTTQVNAIAPQYLNILGLSVVPLTLFIGLKNMSDGHEDTTPGLIISLGAVVLNALLNPLFIWTFNMGFNGSAWATFVTRICMVLAIWLYLRGNHKYRVWRYHIGLKDWLMAIPFRKELNEFLKVGLPSGLQFFFEIAAFGGAAAMMGNISVVAGASHVVAIQLAALTYMAATGFSVAGSILTGSARGAGDTQGILVAGKRSLVMVTVWMSFTCLCFIIFSQELTALFNHKHEPELQQYAASLLIIAGFFQLADGLQCVGLGILRGIGDTRVPTWITLVAYWVIGLPLGYILGPVLGYDGAGIWWALCAGLCFSAVALNWRFFGLVKRMGKKATIQFKSC